MFRIKKLKTGRKNSIVKTEIDQSSVFDHRFKFALLEEFSIVLVQSILILCPCMYLV